MVMKNNIFPILYIFLLPVMDASPPQHSCWLHIKKEVRYCMLKNYISHNALLLWIVSQVCAYHHRFSNLDVQ